MLLKKWVKGIIQLPTRSLHARLDLIDKREIEIKELFERYTRNSAETNWAAIYNSTIEGTEWLKSRSFSPGRWAVGYQYLYVLYRILNEIHPKNILDLGLGQSSWMIAQYAASMNTVSHIVVEHDPNWISFFVKDHQLSENTKIIQLDWNYTNYKETIVREYGGFSDTFTGQKFDLISIDGPLGGDMPIYARIDVLKMLPDILSDDFIILIDDSHRSGERNTILDMKIILKEHDIPFAEGIYSGAKDMTVICAEHLHFLTSM